VVVQPRAAATCRADKFWSGVPANHSAPQGQPGDVEGSLARHPRVTNDIPSSTLMLQRPQGRGFERFEVEGPPDWYSVNLK